MSEKEDAGKDVRASGASAEGDVVINLSDLGRRVFGLPRLVSVPVKWEISLLMVVVRVLIFFEGRELGAKVLGRIEELVPMACIGAIEAAKMRIELALVCESICLSAKGDEQIAQAVILLARHMEGRELGVPGVSS